LELELLLFLADEIKSWQVEKWSDISEIGQNLGEWLFEKIMIIRTKT
jgi:hypothetical protein